MTLLISDGVCWAWGWDLYDNST